MLRKLVAEDFHVSRSQDARPLHQLAREPEIDVRRSGLGLNVTSGGRGHPPAQEVVDAEAIGFTLEVVRIDHQAIRSFGVVVPHLFRACLGSPSEITLVQPNDRVVTVIGIRARRHALVDFELPSVLDINPDRLARAQVPHELRALEAVGLYVPHHCLDLLLA